MVNRETSLQIDASTNTFACKELWVYEVTRIVGCDHCFNSQGMGMKSEACHVARNGKKKVKKQAYILGKMYRECMTRALSLSKERTLMMILCR